MKHCKKYILPFILGTMLWTTACGGPEIGTYSLQGDSSSSQSGMALQAATPANGDVLFDDGSCECTVRDGVLTTIHLRYKLLNNSREDLVQINFDITLRNGAGEVIDTLPCALNMQDETFDAGDEISFERYYKNLAIEVGETDVTADAVVTGYYTDKQMQPIHEPEILKDTVEADGITVKLESLVAEYVSYYGTTIKPDVEISNQSSYDLTEVHYELALYDGNKELIDVIKGFWQADGEPLQAGKSIVDPAEGGFPRILDGQVVSAEMLSVTYKTTEEEPVITLPQVGDYLYQVYGDEHLANIKENQPVRITLSSLTMGGESEYEITGAQNIRDAVDKFCEITIKGDGMSVTDYYNTITFEFSDGTSTSLSLEMEYLVFYGNSGPHNYELNGIKAFMSCF